MNTSTGATITLDCNPQKETDAQSEAAKVAARRREQNRLAQQKHRSKAREQNENQAQQQQRTQQRKSPTPSREQAPPTPADTTQDSQSVHMSEDFTNEGICSLESHWGGMSFSMDQMPGPSGQTFPGKKPLDTFTEVSALDKNSGAKF